MMKKPDALVPIIWAMGAVGYGIAGAVWKDDAPWVLNLSLTTLVIMAALNDRHFGPGIVGVFIEALGSRT